MEALTKKEEEIMNIIWQMENALVRDMIKQLPEPHPPTSTISSVVRILEKKGFVGHKAYGKTHEYYPLISKSAYRKASLKRLMGQYFSGSYKQLVSFIVQEELSEQEAEELSEYLDQKLKKKP